MRISHWPNADWDFIDPAASNIDESRLAELGSIIESEYAGMNGIVVAIDGSIAYERYFNGFGPMDRHHVASVTKSFISALIGIAVDAKLIASEDQRVLDFFPEYAPGEDGGSKREIALRHLLSMTAPYAFEDWREPLEALCAQADWAGYILGLLGMGGRIGDFKYSSSGAQLLSCILSRAAGKSAREFANERLFSPIGMPTIPDHAIESFGYDELFGEKLRGWAKDPAGNSTGGWGLRLAPRDMARFGLLYLGRGAWNGRRVVSERWIDESTSPHSTFSLDGSLIRYGYLWWLSGDLEPRAYMARGDGGNIICCVPEKRAVVAIAAAAAQGSRDSWTLIRNHILPAIRS